MSNSNGNWCLYVAVAACVFACLPTTAVLGAEHAVAEGESIGDVLRRAVPGDTIHLQGASYSENLVIDVPVTLMSERQATIRGGYQGNVVHITAPGTVLQNIHIAEAGPHLTKDMACVLVEADDVTIRDCTITESLHGIYVKGGNRTRIIGNRVEGRLDLIEADRGNGIHLWNSANNQVLRNEIFNVRDGIYFSFADSTEVVGNHIHHARYGLHYMYSNHNAFVDNLFENNVAGAALMYSEDISFTRNTFARCRGFRAYGILLQSMSGVSARANLLLDNSRGIFMNNTNSSAFEQNDVVDNDLAVQLNGGCEKNKFLHNNFINNLSELLLDVSDRETQWADREAGNYWSRYRGYDLDRDGVGDIPFSIQNVFQVLESQVPEVRFYLLSPAAELLRAAEEVLPILRLGDAEDPLPLMLPSKNEEVPWEAVRELSHTPSPTWAAVFFATAMMPVGVLLLTSRRSPARSRKIGGSV
ncbi:MAG: nitrous oxide reductase family maturation protein NosD [bacterium]|nr:nitrous oxide reductase family maturation protein NosD [bacterium]